MVRFALLFRQPGQLFLAGILIVTHNIVESRDEVCQLPCSGIAIIVSLECSLGGCLHRVFPVAGKVLLAHDVKAIVECFVCSRARHPSRSEGKGLRLRFGIVAGS